jgi:hypothetical protein
MNKTDIFCRQFRKLLPTIGLEHDAGLWSQLEELDPGYDIPNPGLSDTQALSKYYLMVLGRDVKHIEARKDILPIRRILVFCYDDLDRIGFFYKGIPRLTPTETCLLRTGAIVSHIKRELCFRGYRVQWAQRHDRGTEHGSVPIGFRASSAQYINLVLDWLDAQCQCTGPKDRVVCLVQRPYDYRRQCIVLEVSLKESI